MNRAQRRTAAKQAKKSGNDELEQKIAVFGKLQDECLTCQKPFDKKDKDMVMSWSVVVKEDEVNLYCPDCWSKALKIVEEFKTHLETKNEDRP